MVIARETVPYLGTSGGRTYRWGGDYVGDSALSAEVVTKVINFSKRATLHHIVAYARKNSGLSLYYRIMGDTGELGTWYYLGKLRRTSERIGFKFGRNKGRQVQFKVISSGEDYPSIFKGLDLTYSMEDSDG